LRILRSKAILHRRCFLTAMQLSNRKPVLALFHFNCYLWRPILACFSIWKSKKTMLVEMCWSK